MPTNRPQSPPEPSRPPDGPISPPPPRKPPGGNLGAAIDSYEARRFDELKRLAEKAWELLMSNPETAGKSSCARLAWLCAEEMRAETERRRPL